MNALLSSKQDIQKFIFEYQLYAIYNFDPAIISKLFGQEQELILEECEL